jgi:hypothetical protein
VIPTEGNTNLDSNKLAGLICVTKSEGHRFAKDGMRIERLTQVAFTQILLSYVTGATNKQMFYFSRCKYQITII